LLAFAALTVVAPARLWNVETRWRNLWRGAGAVHA
jgi:hypothetical protein